MQQDKEEKIIVLGALYTYLTEDQFPYRVFNNETGDITVLPILTDDTIYVTIDDGRIILASKLRQVTGLYKISAEFDVHLPDSFQRIRKSLIQWCFEHESNEKLRNDIKALEETIWSKK